MKSIKGLITALFAIFVFVSLANNCRRRPQTNRPPTQMVETRTIMADQNLVDASEQFDLRVLEKLLKETADAAELEKRLNEKPLVHNLDLDENDEVDYIQVEEFGSGDQRGLSLFVELPPLEGEREPQTQEIASIQISREGESGEVEVRGNRHIYGNNHYYHSRFGVGDYLLMRWMFSDHNRYRSPYGYNRYPSDYGRWDPVPNNRYQSNVRGTTAGSTLQPSSRSTLRNAPTSPNANQNARNIKAPLKNPTSTQRSFQARNPSKQVRGGGFGRTTSTRSSSNTSRSNPSVRRSSSSRSGGFGRGGK